MRRTIMEFLMESVITGTKDGLGYIWDYEIKPVIMERFEVIRDKIMDEFDNLRREHK